MQIIASHKQSGTENTTVLSFDKQEFATIHWIENKREFCYNGKLYDVIDIVYSRETVLIHCKNDSAEDRLFASLEDHIANQVSVPHTTASRKMFSFGGKLYFLNDDKHSIKLYTTNALLSSPVDIHDSLVYFEIKSPPPKVA